MKIPMKFTKFQLVWFPNFNYYFEILPVINQARKQRNVIVRQMPSLDFKLNRREFMKI